MLFQWIHGCCVSYYRIYFQSVSIILAWWAQFLGLPICSISLAKLCNILVVFAEVAESHVHIMQFKKALYMLLLLLLLFFFIALGSKDPEG